MTLDAATFIIVTVLGIAIGLVLLYFVIKNAIKNALREDREFQAKVQRMRESVTPSPSRAGNVRAGESSGRGAENGPAEA